MELVSLLLQVSHLFRLYGEVATEFCDLPFYALWPIDRWRRFTFPQRALRRSRLLHGIPLMRGLCQHSYPAPREDQSASAVNGF